MNIQSAIKKGQLILKSKKIKTAELDSYILMSKAINKEKKFLILNSEEKISKKNLDNFDILINQRANGKPVAYLIEKKDFFTPKEKKHSMLLNINNLIYKLQPNDKELRILASIISSLSRK